MVATLAAMSIARDRLGLDAGNIVTVSFLTLALAQVWHVFNMTDPGQPLLVNDVTRNPYVWGAVALCIGLVAAACYVPPLAKVLRLTALDGGAWLLVLAASLAAMIAGKAVTLGLARLLAGTERASSGQA
jgi:Ca2+-transporting ATPase